MARARIDPGVVATVVGVELLLSAVEGLVVVYPLVMFFPSVADHYAVVVGGLGVGLALWCGLVARCLWPILHRDEGRYRRAQALPGRSLCLRLGIWLLLGLAASVYLVQQGALVPKQVFTVLTICVVHPLAVSLVRWALQKRTLRGYLARHNLHPPWLQLQADTLFDYLIEVSLVVGAVMMAFLGPFLFMFVPISLEQFMLMETYFPWVGVVLGAAWYYLVAPAFVRPVLQYLRQASRGDRPAKEVIWAACRAAHRLPTVQALSKLGFFVLGALLLLLQGLALYEFSLLQGLLVFFAIVILTLGTGIYEMIWSRAVLRPVVAHLMALPEVEGLALRPPSLRYKMLLSFGGAVVFTVLLAFFWTYLQYGNLRLDFAATQAERELETVAAHLADAPPEAIAHRIAALRPVVGSRYLFVPERGRGPAPLSETATATVRRRVDGMLQLADRHLAGVYRRVDASRPSLGSLVVLLPLGQSAKFALNLQVLVVFFVAVLVVSLGVVMLTSTNLAHPLVLLEQRASAMAEGKLDLRVLPGGEHDEIGRLTAAFEQMRRALRQKIQTIEQLNVGLEEKVRLRTAELERSNAELVEAIRALKEAQQRLIVSEKLASVGQLVAGIAHEINNPLNAVVNTVRPLAETVDELVRGDCTGAELEEARGDLEAMLRVMRSAAERTQRIVQALRSYSRQDGEERSAVDLHADIEESLALLQHGLRGIEVRRELAATGELWAYRGQLNQVLVNLITNAASALEGRPDPRIIIRTRDQGDRVAIEVEDNGPGIPEEVLPRIFDPFFTTKETGKGTGLGLSITQTIVEHHGGRIGVRSEPDRGATFTVVIPRGEAAGA